ncbi:hypothetical protein N1851_023276 [Merluccius polli]|uniref:Gag protein n=1 Tax=Merluccius polli TaxID=89951 RepID=A0AA47MGV2_MERPO|nr:hypothetical protein N1851_023276 [Merluccius polli]
MGCTPNPRNSSQFNTPNRDRSIDCSASQTRPCRPRQYTIEDFMAPLLTDGAGREVYTPWGHRDMHTLANTLPPLTAGAQAWVRKFEMETSGDNLAMGDIRAIISRTYGPRRTKELERMAGTTNLADRTPLDPYRNHLWDCLRELFPGDMKKAGISNIHIKPEENIYQYIQRAEDLWVDRNDERPSDSRIGLQTFQEALIKGLTPPVQKTLKMVASLDYMTWDRWVEQLVHHYHLDQERQEEKNGEYEDLKLVLLKMKIKEQADLNKKAKNTQEPSTMMPLATTLPAPQASAPTTSNNAPQVANQASAPTTSDNAPQVANQASLPVTPVPNAIPTVGLHHQEAKHLIILAYHMPCPHSNMDRYDTRIKDIGAGGDEVEGSQDFPLRDVFTVVNRDIGLENAPVCPRIAPHMDSRSPRIPTRALPHRVRQCIPYTNRGARRTSERGGIWASVNLQWRHMWGVTDARSWWIREHPYRQSVVLRETLLHYLTAL